MVNPIDKRVMFKEPRFSQDQVVGEVSNHSIQNRCVSISSHQEVMELNRTASDLSGFSAECQDSLPKMKQP